MKHILKVLFLLSLCYGEDFTIKQSEIADYLELEIKHKNPLEEVFKVIGLPAPLLSTEEVVVIKENSSFVIRSGDSFLDSGLDKISTLLTDYIADSLREKGKNNFVTIAVDLDGVAHSDKRGIGGDLDLLFKVYEGKVTQLEILSGVNRNPLEHDWSERYGIRHTLQHLSLDHLYFRQSIVQEEGRIDERTWRYGVEYAPFKNFATYIERENNKLAKDSTEAGVRYRILF